MPCCASPYTRSGSAVLFCLLTWLWQCVDLGLHYQAGFITFPHASANAVFLTFPITMSFLAYNGTYFQVVLVGCAALLFYYILMGVFVVLAPSLYEARFPEAEAVPSVIAPVAFLAAVTTILWGFAVSFASKQAKASPPVMQ